MAFPLKTKLMIEIFDPDTDHLIKSVKIKNKIKYCKRGFLGKLAYLKE